MTSHQTIDVLLATVTFGTSLALVASLMVWTVRTRNMLILSMALVMLGICFWSISILGQISIYGIYPTQGTIAARVLLLPATVFQFWVFSRAKSGF